MSIKKFLVASEETYRYFECIDTHPHIPPYIYHSEWKDAAERVREINDKHFESSSENSDWRNSSRAEPLNYQLDKYHTLLRKGIQWWWNRQRVEDYLWFLHPSSAAIEKKWAHHIFPPKYMRQVTTNARLPLDGRNWCLDMSERNREAKEPPKSQHILTDAKVWYSLTAHGDDQRDFPCAWLPWVSNLFFFFNGLPREDFDIKNSLKDFGDLNGKILFPNVTGISCTIEL